MKGQNIIRGMQYPDTPPLEDKLLQVREVFLTVQGEGPFSGRPAIFVRLTGCCLRCWFCDTKWDDEADEYLLASGIAARALSSIPRNTVQPDLAVITGGEPTNWPLEILCRTLHNCGFKTVQIETAGVRWSSAFNLPFVHVVVSPKTPRIDPALINRSRNVWFKYPLNVDEVDETDGLPVTNTQNQNGQHRRLARPDWLKAAPERVFVTPLETEDPVRDELNARLVARAAIKFGYTAQLQVHKYMGVS